MIVFLYHCKMRENFAQWYKLMEVNQEENGPADYEKITIVVKYMFGADFFFSVNGRESLIDH